MSHNKSLEENIKSILSPLLIHYSQIKIIEKDTVIINDISQPINFDGPPPLIHYSQINIFNNSSDPQSKNDDSGLTDEQKVYIKSNFKQILANTPLSDFYEHKPLLSRFSNSERIQMREESVLYIKIINFKKNIRIDHLYTKYTFVNNVYECNICHKKYQNKYTLKYHILHEEIKCEFKYNCIKCDYKNDNKSHFRNHFRYQHGLDIDMILKKKND